MTSDKSCLMRGSALLLILAMLIIGGIAGTADAMSGSSISGLAGEWNFDGNAQDSSGNGNHGSVFGAKYVDGIKGQALEFDGMDNYFSAPVTDALNSVKSEGTIFAWIKFRDNYLIKETGTSCSSGSRSLTIWRLGTYASKSGARIDCVGRIISDWRIDDLHTGQVTSQLLKSGTWYHVALVYNGEGVVLFINGQRANSSKFTGGLNSSDGRFWIGRDGNAFYHMYFDGIVDEVKIYNRALSAEEIQAYYNPFLALSASPTAPLYPDVTYPDVTSTEKHDSIIRVETVTNDLLANKAVEYSFYYPEHGIYEIAVTGNKNEYNVPIRVEALDGNSVLVQKPAPGKVYRNLNILGDTKGIKEARIKFKVKNSWIESNDVGYYDIRMLRWDGGKWVQLDTTKTTKDNDYSYYEAKTYGFSTFAISGIKNTVQASTKTLSSESPKPQPQNNSWLWLIILIVLIWVLSKRFHKLKTSMVGSMIPPIVIPKMPALKPPEKPSPKDLNITSAFGYKGATILYKVKVENIVRSPIADIRVSLFIPNVFLLLEKEKSLALLKPGESKTVTFDIRPTGECGDCEVSGKVTYYDTGNNRTKEMDIGSKMLSIVCPMLKVKEVSESEWHSIVSNLIETEEGTKEIDMPAETLFTMASRIIKDMHMHMLNPEITQSQQLFNGVARFFGEGVKGLKYAAVVEVVGGARKAKLILRAWAEKEDALTGFYHGILDEIEKRINVKGYIDEPIVQHFNIAGHYVTGQVGKIIDVGDRSVQESKEQ